MNTLTRFINAISGHPNPPQLEQSPLAQVEARLNTMGMELNFLHPAWQVEVEGEKTTVTTNIPRMDKLEPLTGTLAITIEPGRISLNDLADTTRALSIEQDPALCIPANRHAVASIMNAVEGDARMANLVASRQLSELNDHRSQGSALNMNRF